MISRLSPGDRLYLPHIVLTSVGIVPQNYQNLLMDICGGATLY